MICANEKKKEHFLSLVQNCKQLKADVRPCMEEYYCTIAIPPPWSISRQKEANEVQEKIKEWSEQYPDVVCYCFDSYSTLIYVL